MDASKRFDKMIAELVELKGHWETIVAAELHWQQQGVQAHEAQLYETRTKLEKDLLKIWSQIRGYKHEADITVKQISKLRVSADESVLGKQGDVAFILPDGQSKVFQAKSFSGTDNSPLNAHIKKACAQLFGSNPNEIPAVGAQLIAEIDVHSGKAYWPYTDSTYLKGKYRKLTKHSIEAKARDKIEELINDGLDEAAAAVKKRATTAGYDGKNAVLELYKRLETSVIAVRIKYKKQLQGDVLGYAEKEVGRSTDGPVKSIAVLVKIQNGRVNIQQTKIK